MEDKKQEGKALIETNMAQGGMKMITNECQQQEKGEKDPETLESGRIIQRCYSIKTLSTDM